MADTKSVEGDQEEKRKGWLSRLGGATARALKATGSAARKVAKSRDTTTVGVMMMTAGAALSLTGVGAIPGAVLLGVGAAVAAGSVILRKWDARREAKKQQPLPDSSSEPQQNPSAAQQPFAPQNSMSNQEIHASPEALARLVGQLAAQIEAAVQHRQGAVHPSQEQGIQGPWTRPPAPHFAPPGGTPQSERSSLPPVSNPFAYAANQHTARQRDLKSPSSRVPQERRRGANGEPPRKRQRRS